MLLGRQAKVLLDDEDEDDEDELLLPGGPEGAVAHWPLRVSFCRPVKLQAAPTVLPVQAATASGGGPGG
ncbi:hypothetical protein PSQ39_07930 [Curvibacter sp. HBC28]|uniref:Uncharacterized protein n=1 Tax=Curvibacter microcysteis TaxID=3026419 RepID=A0ABT5MDA0_9BURK|nr:hypothetical protein [Curvibacter sp. HBC28]